MVQFILPKSILLYSLSTISCLVRAAPAPEPSVNSDTHGSGIKAACTQLEKSSKSCGLLVGQTATTIVTSSSAGSTWKETFVGTSLQAFSTLTAPTTITTADTAGETVVAVILAGGLAWLAVPKPGVPPVSPPHDPPTITSPPSEPSSHPVTTTSSTSATSSSQLPPQPELVSLPDPDWQKIFKGTLVSYSSNHIACGRPANGETTTIDRKTMSSKIDAFCSEKNGVVANQTIPTNDYFNVGGGKVVNITVSQYPLCAGGDKKESTIYEDDCKYYLHEALDSCDTNTLDKHGGIVNNACLNWELHPHLNNGILNCGKPIKDGTGFNREEAMSNVQKFCQGHAGKKISRKSSEKQTYKPRVGNSNMEISASMSNSHDCDPDKEADYNIDEAACQRFLFRAVDDCDTNYKGYLGKYGGSVTDACGVFSFSTKVEEIVKCGGAQALHPHPANLTPDATDGGIKRYCDTSFTLDPNYKPDGHFHQNGAPGTSKDSYPADGIAVRLATYFDDELQMGCATRHAFDTKGDECRRKMGLIKDQCGKEGGVVSSNTLDGCTVWTLYGSEG